MLFWTPEDFLLLFDKIKDLFQKVIFSALTIHNVSKL